jgi:hypothetical protein
MLLNRSNGAGEGQKGSSSSSNTWLWLQLVLQDPFDQWLIVSCCGSCCAPGRLQFLPSAARRTFHTPALCLLSLRCCTAAAGALAE